jgi:hypothetical protein
LLRRQIELRAEERARHAREQNTRPSGEMSRHDLVTLLVAWGDLLPAEADRMTTADLALRYDRCVARFEAP